MDGLIVIIVLLIIGLIFYQFTGRNDSKDPVTFFSYIHFLVGFFFSYFNILSFPAFIILHISFEIWESSSYGIKFFEGKDKFFKNLRDKMGIDFSWNSYGGDTVANSNCDTLFAITGYLSANYITGNTGEAFII